MQDLQGVDPIEFLAAGQEPLIKFEIYVNSDWINLCDMPVERLTDGGLEDWAAADDLTYWTEGIVTATQGVFRNSVTVHSGLYSARMLTTSGGELAWFYQDFTLTPGNICTVSLWYIKGAHAASDLLVYVSDTGFNVSLKSDGTWQAGYLPIFMDDSAVWKLYELEFTAHALYSNYRIRFYKNQTAGAAISYYIDDVAIKDGTLGNFLESASVSLGGASMTPNPVEGVWSASLFNEDSIFYPQHPTSLFNDYLKTGRKTKLSIGAIYGEVGYYWQQIIGYMDVPKYSLPDYKVSISGGDYMKNLEETELKFPDNYWGDSETYASIPSGGLSTTEMYTNADAMDINLEEDDVVGWTDTSCTLVSLADDEGGSDFVGKVTGQGARPIGISNLDIGGNATEGTMYQVKFKHRIVGGTGIIAIKARIDQASGRCFVATYFPTDDWQEETFYFTALDTGPIIWRFIFMPTAHELRLDQFSIKEFTPYWMRYYELLGLDPTSKGPYHVTLDGVDVWQGEVDEGWYYVEDELEGEYPHPAEVVFFDPNKVVLIGLDVIIYYYTQQEAQDIVGRLLYFAGLYDSAEDAITAIEAHAEYVDPDVQIDRVWFEVGTTCLEAIRMVCERCDYRFYFDYDGEPVFRPRATEEDPVDFAFTDPRHIASVRTYQDRNEIKNRIIIKGWKQAEPVEREETKPSEFEGERSDADSIALYGERTLTITNHLFQDDDSINNAVTGMCAILLAEYKNPIWYSDIKVPFNPVPLELGDTISWKEMLSPTLADITQKGIIRDIKINQFNATYKCEQV